PRPPQGQPIVSALGHATVPYQLIATSADVGFVTPADAGHARRIVDEIRAATHRPDPVRVLGDLVVFLGPSAAAAAERKARLDELAGYPYTSDATIFTGTAAELADLLIDWRQAG